MQELQDNEKLIKAILENMNAGKLQACAGYAHCRICPLGQQSTSFCAPESEHKCCFCRYQKKLQQNLMRLASIADAQPPPVPGNDYISAPVATVSNPAAAQS